MSGWCGERENHGPHEGCHGWPSPSRRADEWSIRSLVVTWFHDSEEICEHDEPPWVCEIMADNLLAAFYVSVRDWKAFAAPNRLDDFDRERWTAEQDEWARTHRGGPATSG